MNAKRAATSAALLHFGAGEESRTLDLNLGKVTLYQLSYSREEYFEGENGSRTHRRGFAGRFPPVKIKDLQLHRIFYRASPPFSDVLITVKPQQ